MGNYAAKVTAQVAVEAIVNAPSGYDTGTMRTVLAVAKESGVSEFYTDMLSEILDNASE